MTTKPRPVAERDIPLLTCKPNMHPEMFALSDLPGIVIFIHGVNDPGGNYDIIEEGLCEGLNERLDAFRLVPGKYGEAYAKAKEATSKPGDDDYAQVAQLRYDPDTYLYERKEVQGEIGTATHSTFIPFYWGYRASKDEIAMAPPNKGGDKDGYKTRRGQYLDKQGNRLSKHFAKGGGMFNNATNSIPPMFGEGFDNSMLNKAAALAMSKYEFSGKSPHRRYMVLAAERLAMLVRDIRAVASDDTITIIGHSQGTLVTLLAQALLIDGRPERTNGETTVPAIAPARPADCLILVDSPYALIQPAMEKPVQPDHDSYSTHGKLNTLTRLVEAVYKARHAEPALHSLTDPCVSRGKTGEDWKPQGGAIRRQRDRQSFTFTERDNRGKVYMYFCPEDGTVDLPNIKGMGSEGIPDTIIEPGTVRVVPGDPRHWSELPHTKPGLEGMSRLKHIGFFQRAWTRSLKDLRGTPADIGREADYLEFVRGIRIHINGEAISPPYQPNMYGGEVVRGTPDTPGKVTPNDYTKDLAIGNREAVFKMIFLGNVEADHSPVESEKEKFNAGKEPDDQTYRVTAEITGMSRYSGRALYLVHREMTPNEARIRMDTEPGDRQTNSYHSAALSHVDNLRRVAAMDVAIGQAKALDDPDWRRLFIALADWKMTTGSFRDIETNPRFAQLGEASHALARGNLAYYSRGEFPLEIVAQEAPSLIDKETVGQRIWRAP